MAKSIEIDVNPELLSWARKSLALSEADAAERLHEDVQFILDLESGLKKPTISILRRLSDYYKRPVSVFFLPAPPETPPIPTDFRVLPGHETEPLSKPTLLAVRKSRWLREEILDLANELGYETKAQLPETDIKDDIEKVAIKERNRLGITVEDQCSWPSGYGALNQWRNILTDNNILIFQMDFPREQARGFSLVYEHFPVITVSSKDRPPEARIFTLLHEYAHLLLRDDGICIPHRYLKTSGFNKTEDFCNKFAGAFLIPISSLEQDINRIGEVGDDSELENITRKIAAKYRVTRFVALYRLADVGFISDRIKREKLSIWFDQILGKKPRKESDSEFRRNVPALCLSEKGSRVVSLLMEAQDAGLISLKETLDLLSLNQHKHYQKLEERLLKPNV